MQLVLHLLSLEINVREPEDPPSPKEENPVESTSVKISFLISPLFNKCSPLPHKK